MRLGEEGCWKMFREKGMERMDGERQQYWTMSCFAGLVIWKLRLLLMLFITGWCSVPSQQLERDSASSVSLSYHPFALNESSQIRNLESRSGNMFEDVADGWP